MAHNSSTELLSDLAANFHHPLWSEIELMLLSNDSSLWPQLLQHQALIAVALFRLENEFLFLGQLVKYNFSVEIIDYSDWLNAVNACQKFLIDLLGGSDAQDMVRLYIKQRIELIVKTMPSLTTMMAWVEYQMWGELPEPVMQVALAKSKNAYSLVENLWQGEDSLLQTKLLRTHSSVELWPSSKLFTKALSAFYKKSPNNIQHVLDTSNHNPRETLFWPLFHDYKCTVVNLPVLLGLWSMSPVPMRWWSQHPERQGCIQQLLKFNPIWFQLAFNQGGKIALVLDFHDELNRA
ncbi:hypothetical protein [Agitococcus lubricus]|uniref:Uncharacterized protein n=1 Tax=Agitococcus lubricus TaxID=1077255 RepID=A0A2T5ITJ1_9GAMM|nr:hypothetical protein [Agitococcus lubricus]PTQ87183.1 hypothetical protein C8N29_12118 [Agitococcus lubricus]